MPLRSRESLPRETVLLHGDVPREIVVNEHGVRYAAAPWTGQKTGAFLDQRENRVLLGGLARGRALDCFSYHGSFALHLARRADQVVAIDSSAEALARARENAALNDLTNVECVEANAFDYLRDLDRAGERFDTIALDPPAFAKTRDSLEAALRGYHEINLRAMRLLAPGGHLYTASCSFHMTKALFLEMVERAAEDSGQATGSSPHARATGGPSGGHHDSGDGVSEGSGAAGGLAGWLLIAALLVLVTGCSG